MYVFTKSFAVRISKASSVIRHSYDFVICTIMELIKLLTIISIVGLTAAVGHDCQIITGQIYSFDSILDGQVTSLTVEEDKSVSVQTFTENQPRQRFIARIITGQTFNLFLEVQPWDWVNYIVESSMTVNIKDKTPQVLATVNVNGIHTVVQQDYNKQDNQKWYIVPSADDENVGLLVNLLTRYCLINEGPNNSATIGICNQNDFKQIWTFSIRTNGRCY